MSIYLRIFRIFRFLARKQKIAYWDIPHPYKNGGHHAEQEPQYTDKILGNGGRKCLIDKKIKLLPTQRYGVYLRKMVIDGYIIYTDTTNIKTFTAELFVVGKNINQIASSLSSGHGGD